MYENGHTETEFETVFTLGHLLILQKASYIPLLKRAEGPGKPLCFRLKPQRCIP